MYTYPLFKVFENDDVTKNMSTVMSSGAIASGPYVERFECELSLLTKLPYVVSTSDVTSAMEIALKLAKIEPGDEVIASPFSCLASNSPIAKLELVPKWVDLSPNSANVNTEHFISLITEKTKVAIIYHLAGYPSDLERISNVCKENSIFLIEDCNNALLAENNGVLVGQLGDAAIFSFYPNRHLHTLEGGAIALKCERLASIAKKLRKFGIDYKDFRNSLGEINPLSDIKTIGLSATLSNFNAAVGVAQLSSLQTNIASYRKNGALYKELLKDIPGITILNAAAYSSPVYWVFLIKVSNRDDVIFDMKRKGVQVSSLHQRNDTYSCFKNKYISDCPEVTNLQNDVLALPCGWWLSYADISNIVSELKEVISQNLDSCNS
jgi:dTDP-4-amino-4,6-dideoxygalactose transaminase